MELRLPRNCVAPSGVLDVVVGSGIVSDDTEINSVVMLKNVSQQSQVWRDKTKGTKSKIDSMEELVDLAIVSQPVVQALVVSQILNGVCSSLQTGFS